MNQPKQQGSSDLDETGAETAGIDPWDEPLVKVNETSRRLGNLLFLFSTSRRTISTQEIVSDGDLGYGSGNPESDKRKFRRDRELLEQRGYLIVPVPQEGEARNEDALWRLDRRDTYMDLSSLSRDDLLTLVHALDVPLSRADVPYRLALKRLRDKIARAVLGVSETAGAAIGGREETEKAEDGIGTTLWNAFERRRAVAISYLDAKGTRSERTVLPYGFFELNGTFYLAAEDLLRNGELRTFNVARVESAQVAKRSYRIPADFDVSGRVHLPFDFGDDDPVDATFVVPSSMAAAERDRVTLGRGRIERSGGLILWTVPMRSKGRAAQFALEHRLLPAAPKQLVAAWRDLMRKAVGRHG